MIRSKISISWEDAEIEYDIAEVWKWKLLIDSSEKNKDRNGASMKKLGRLYYIGLFFNGFVSVPLIFWTIVYIIVEVVTGMQRLLEAKRILND